MLAVYLVFKGIEIFQIALMSNRPDRTLGLILGILCIAVAIMAGGGFAWWGDETARAIGEQMNSIPGIQR